jgi:small ligand-binding sensory domain FIST
VLSEAVGAVEGGMPRVRRAGIFAGLAMDPAKSPLGRGDLVRNLIGVDRASGSVGVAEPVRVGQTIQPSSATRRRRRRPARDARGWRRRCAAARPPSASTSSAGRGQGLFGAADHDIGLIREALGELPLAGFFGNGEFAPVGGRNHFHNYTGVLVVFPA